MQAAIWLSDLRGFTALSDRLPAETVVDILNCYFDCQVSAIKDHGGDVLKFMGDGLLAVFPISEEERDMREACARVLEAARQTRASVDALQYRIGDTFEHFRFAVALHVEKLLSAISAAATDSISPASALPSISPRGWKELRLA